MVRLAAGVSRCEKLRRLRGNTRAVSAGRAHAAGHAGNVPSADTSQRVSIAQFSLGKPSVAWVGGGLAPGLAINSEQSGSRGVLTDQANGETSAMAGLAARSGQAGTMTPNSAPLAADGADDPTRFSRYAPIEETQPILVMTTNL